MITNDAIPEGRFATKLRQQGVFLDILRTDLWSPSLVQLGWIIYKPVKERLSKNGPVLTFCFVILNWGFRAGLLITAIEGIVVERWPQLKEGRSRERRNKLGLDDSHVLLLINGWTNGDFFLHFRKFTLTTTIIFTSPATCHLRCTKIRFSHCWASRWVPADVYLVLSPLQRLPLGIPPKKIESERGTMGRGKRLPLFLLPIVPCPLSFSLFWALPTIQRGLCGGESANVVFCARFPSNRRCFSTNIVVYKENCFSW